MISETKDELFKRLSTYYLDHNLDFDLKHSTFEDLTRTIYWYPSNKYSDSIFYQVRLTIKNPDLQRIQNEVFPNSSNFSVHRVTGRNLQHEMDLKTERYVYNQDFLVENSLHVYVIRENESPLPIYEDHTNYMNEIGFSFFNKLDNIDSIHHFINDDILQEQVENLSTDKIKKLSNKSLKQELLAGVIAASIVDKNMVGQLVEKYKIIYEGNRFILKDIIKLVEHLEIPI